MNFLIFFIFWIAITAFANIAMTTGTFILVGPINMDHWIYTAIQVGINMKIYYIMRKHMEVKTNEL